MKTFMAEDNICAQNLLKLVSHGNAIVAEILRLKEYIPAPFNLDSKNHQKYQDVILDFSYFKTSDAQEKKISSNANLQDLDDDLKEKYLELITRFYLLFESIHQYAVDVDSFVEQLKDEAFIQQSIDTVLRDTEGKQLLCESLYLYGAMLLLCDLYISGQVRERLLVAFYRYSTSQSQSNLDEVCKLLRDTGYNQHNGKRPADYPVEYFGRVTIQYHFIEAVIGKMRSEDIYNQLTVYPLPEHRSTALAIQGSMLFVCLFFLPHYLHLDVTKMREIVDKFFPDNWVISIYMGVTINIIDYWDNFKAARTALNNTCNSKMLKELSNKSGHCVNSLINETFQLLKEGTITDQFVLDNTSKIINLFINTNVNIRWILLHTNQVTYFDHNKKSKQLKDLVLKELNYDPKRLLELLISTAQLELKVREVLIRLIDNKVDSWNLYRNEAIEAVDCLSELFSGSKPVTKVSENEQLKLWFMNISKQISSLSDVITSKSMKKIIHLIQALDEVEEFHGIKSASTVIQYLSESKEALKNALRSANLREESLVSLDTVADVSYAWCTIDTYTKIMQDSIKENPSVTSRLRALFLKLASAMEIPLLRINQAHSDDLVSVSQYYSNELIKYIQKVLQIIPEMVFHILDKVINLQTWTIKEVPTRLEKELLREFAQLEYRTEVAKLTHSASTFTKGILDMSATLVGVVRIDPAQLLEDGLLRELSRHINAKFEVFIEPNLKKTSTTSSNLLTRLQILADSMNGYKRSLEYIQDYINIHGLRIWQKQISCIINDSVAKEISLRKGVDLYSPSAGFMGSLARQIAMLTDCRQCCYIGISVAWFDVKTHTEIVNTKTFSKLNEAVGAVGLHGLSNLYGFMITNQLHYFLNIFRNGKDKIIVDNRINQDQIHKQIDQVVLKGSKVILQIVEILVIIGTLQLLRKHIAHQLNTSCKFDSAHLETSLSTLNESLLNELKSNSKREPKLTTELINSLDGYLSRCGIYDPYEKIYMRNMNQMLNSDIAFILVAVLISQLHRLQISSTTGEIIAKKVGDNIDGFPLMVGIYTLLRQCHEWNVDSFVEYLCNYAKSHTLTVIRSKSGEFSNETAFVIRFLESFCQTFNYSYAILEDKLPLTSLTVPPTKSSS